MALPPGKRKHCAAMDTDDPPCSSQRQYAAAATTPDTRTRILKAARQLFRKRGYHGTESMTSSRAAQAPKGSMYHHFRAAEQIGVCVINDLN